MNNLIAQVIQIDSLENLNIVKFDYKGNTLSMMSLGLTNIKVGSSVSLGINASHISVAKEFSGELSLSNRFECIIEKIDEGKLLSSLTLKQGELSLTSIITTNSVKRMSLKVNDNITALIKASDLSIQKVIS